MVKFDANNTFLNKCDIFSTDVASCTAGSLLDTFWHFTQCAPFGCFSSGLRLPGGCGLSLIRNALVWNRKMPLITQDSHRKRFREAVFHESFVDTGNPSWWVECFTKECAIDIKFLSLIRVFVVYQTVSRSRRFERICLMGNTTCREKEGARGKLSLSDWVIAFM